MGTELYGTRQLSTFTSVDETDIVLGWKIQNVTCISLFTTKLGSGIKHIYLSTMCRATGTEAGVGV